MKVKYFAWVRERIGKSEETVEPPANVRTVEDLIAWLAHQGEDSSGHQGCGDDGWCENGSSPRHREEEEQVPIGE